MDEPTFIYRQNVLEDLTSLESLNSQLLSNVVASNAAVVTAIENINVNIDDSNITSNLEATQQRQIYADYNGSAVAIQSTQTGELRVNTTNTTFNIQGMDYAQPSTAQDVKVNSSGLLHSNVYGYNGSNDIQLQMDSNNNLKTV